MGLLAVGWFGFNVMSAQTIHKISGLVAVNSLTAMAGGTLVATVLGRSDPGFAYNYNDPASSTTDRWPASWRCAPAPT